ncbi:signal transduction histidine kinase [Kibdelosporangium banguiense]|uniref:histidine kinase n=1 Tax=Kibdelosporangium banguiense TaxID=1365924 RepID=A0ABS4TIT0_9PSEU|nr:sensor histidine kinase [Kibdelosporangium banguiense]MBP2324319.1 signal transduction histidine kinase [Kibdelosporangium banguiense]
MNRRIADIGHAVAVTALLVAAIEAGAPVVSTAGYVLIIISSVSLVLRRLFPAAVLILSTACTLAVYIMDRPDIFIELPVLVALYSALRSGHRLVGISTGLTYLASLVVMNVMILPGHPAREQIQDRVMLLGWFIAAIMLGEAAWLREKRAADQARSNQETALRLAGEERLRIARELHDSLTHSISVIKVQAGVAVHLARKRNEDVPEALLAIQEASGDAVRELRETLAALRGEPETSGLDRLDDLVERTKSAGLPVELTITGSRRALPEEIDRAAYRIVQEALTNVARHAGEARAKVHIGYSMRELTVQIDDDGQTAPDTNPVPGLGLIGMRERVTGLGGVLSATARPDGGFRVRAELPV